MESHYRVEQENGNLFTQTSLPHLHSSTDAFLQVADKLRETVRFAHSVKAEIDEKYGYKNMIVLFRPKQLENKFEPSSVSYEGAEEKTAIQAFIKKN